MAISETLKTIYSGRDAAYALIEHRLDPVKNTLEGKVDIAGLEKMFLEDNAEFITGFAAGVMGYCLRHPINAYKAFKKRD